MPAMNARVERTTTREAAPRRAAPAKALDEWIAEQAAFAQPILTYLRSAVHEAVPDATETMKWSRPFFVVNGTLLAYMAAFKQHCGFGFWSPEMTAVLAADGIAEPGSSGSFGRITSLEDLPPGTVLVRYLRHAADLARRGVATSPMATRPRRTSARAPIAEPAEFTAALGRSEAAKANFGSMSPSCRREYLDWITSAKKAETRDRRIAEAVARLSEGKRFNEQYRAS